MADIDQQARMLVVPAALPGRIMQALKGTDEELLGKEKIHFARRIPAPDGTEIHVWGLRSAACPREAGDGEAPSAPSRGTMVLLHGLMTSSSWFLKLGQQLFQNGWDVLLPDLRAHGRSGGQYITWGAKEKIDVRSVVDHCLAEGLAREPIYVVGSSLGGMVAIQYAAIDPRCRGVLALAPPAGAREICRRILLMASEAAYAAALNRAGVIAGFDPDEASTVRAAASLQCPLVLVHGWWDIVVPYQHSQAILHAARPPKKLIRQVLQGHGADFRREKWLVRQIESLVKTARAMSV